MADAPSPEPSPELPSETEGAKDGEQKKSNRKGARVIGVDSEDADDLINALSSDTARRILSNLHENEATPSEIADGIDTTLQNARYHLENLENAGLINVVDTRYSPKGREMKVYAPSDDTLIVFPGREEEATGLRDALTRLFGLFVVLGIVSGVVQFVSYFFQSQSQAQSQAPTAGDGGAGGAGGGDVGISSQAEKGSEALDTAAQGAEPFLQSLPPGALFFAGGTLVLIVGFTWWYFRNRRG
ncbi:MAG: helix-turn-helix domain-containing protein [Halobacteria archaeon]|nr:helix-turn-helix domain-containing protein [Halobacteria archaeon]